MAVATTFYNQYTADLMNKAIDMEADDIKVALLDINHTFDNADTIWADVSTNEIIGLGYTAGGVSITGKTVTKGNTTVFDATDIEWTDSTFLTYYAVVYNASNLNNLICSIDLDGENLVAEGVFILSWNNLGVFGLSPA